MRHPSWNELNKLITEISRKHGGASGWIHDYRCGKRWDSGQAVCAELYGPDWSSDPRFKEDNALGDQVPVPNGALDAARRVLAGTAWMRPGEPVREGSDEG